MSADNQHHPSQGSHSPTAERTPLLGTGGHPQAAHHQADSVEGLSQDEPVYGIGLGRALAITASVGTLIFLQSEFTLAHDRAAVRSGKATTGGEGSSADPSKPAT